MLFKENNITILLNIDSKKMFNMIEKYEVIPLSRSDFEWMIV